MSETEAIEWVRVLNGHVDAETAYRVEDYPYGRVLRCKIRYWIDTVDRRGQRFVSQTTNPKAPGEAWNAPKRSTYSAIRVMYLDGIDHVQAWGAHLHLSPVEDARMRMMGIYDQLTDADRSRYDGLLKLSHAYAPQWREWEGRICELASHIRETGTDPEIIDGRWRAPSGLCYLPDSAVYVAAARQEAGK